MKVKLVESLLKESIDKEELFQILKLIGQAHDCIMKAQDKIQDLSYEYEDEIIDSLSYDLDDIEASVSELDFMDSDDPVQEVYEHYDLNLKESKDDDLGLPKEVKMNKKKI